MSDYNWKWCSDPENAVRLMELFAKNVVVIVYWQYNCLPQIVLTNKPIPYVSSELMAFLDPDEPAQMRARIEELEAKEKMAKRHPLLKEAKATRKFPDNTCSYSRHALEIGEALMLGKPYSMLTDEPDHCGASIVGTVANLWKTRVAIRVAESALSTLQHQVEFLNERLKQAQERIAELEAASIEEYAAQGYD